MARPLRLEFPGALYHVTARGNGRQPIFMDDADRERFLTALASAVARYHLLCHAYCLMGNHYHALLETPEGNLSAAMRQLNGVRSLSGVTGRAGAISAYVRFVEAALGQSDDALDRFRSKPELADPELARRLDEHCRAVAQCPEIPRAQRFASRPPLDQLFDGVVTRADRNARAVTAVRDHGYAPKEVADFLRRHYVTVSRALAHADGLPSR